MVSCEPWMMARSRDRHETLLRGIQHKLQLGEAA